MGIAGVRQFIVAQVRETPEWLRDVFIGLSLGIVALALWTGFRSNAMHTSASALELAQSRPVLSDHNVTALPDGPVGAPLLWQVKQGPTTIYLFGSVHVLRANLNWMDRRLFNAFDSADEAWFEVPDLMAKPTIKLRDNAPVRSSGRLTDGLSKNETSELRSLLEPYGYSLSSVAKIQPWAMAQAVAKMDQRAMGFDFSRGADMTLFQRAHDLHLNIHGLETIDQQMLILDQMSHTTKMSGLEQLKTALAAHLGKANAADDLNVLAAYWRTGNEKGLTEGVAADRKIWGEGGYRIMLVQRNQRWTRRIESLLAPSPTPVSKTIFMTVGAAHLVGPDGVVSLLRKDGWDVVRLDP